MQVLELGQVFTPFPTVGQLLELRQHKGSVLEPSCGNGAILTLLESSAVGIEVDSELCPANGINLDFFDYPTNNKFDTIIANPPYVAFKNIKPDTLSKINNNLDKRANLYLFFINKCIDHLKPFGEMIFITPRDFIKLTSASNLNRRLYEEGNMTHFFDLGDEKIFPDAAPNCAIWRWIKGIPNSITQTRQGVRYFNYNNGQISFTRKKYTQSFRDLFFVKVGAVSGKDKIFQHEDGNEFVFSETRKTGQTRRMLYNVKHPHLIPQKETLLARRIKKFNESNWYNWGRDSYNSDCPRVYVNCKTRQKNPFFTHPCNLYEGSILAVFTPYMSPEVARDKLNAVDWDDLGFKVGGRFVFSQRSLENTLLPHDFMECDPSLLQ